MIDINLLHIYTLFI